MLRRISLSWLLSCQEFATSSAIQGLCAIRPGAGCKSRLRPYSSSVDYQQEIDAINDLFVEARDEIDYAKEDAETVYFNESAANAKQATSAALQRWEQLLSKLPQAEKESLQRSMGMKMEQLKAELEQLDHLHA